MKYTGNETAPRKTVAAMWVASIIVWSLICAMFFFAVSESCKLSVGF